MKYNPVKFINKKGEKALWYAEGEDGTLFDDSNKVNPEILDLLLSNGGFIDGKEVFFKTEEECLKACRALQ